MTNLATQLVLVSAVAGVAFIWWMPPGGEFIDLWLTHDQQGARLLAEREPAAAAERFDDPAWQGLARFRAGDYTEAAAVWARVASAEGFYNRGNAHLRAFEYRPAIAAFELAVAEAPDWREANDNLELARYMLDYIERTREQSDTGEEMGIGADDIVYDNKGERGADTEVSRESVVEAQSAEKWMRTVDTETAEFLRSRFLLEASRAGQL